jgi:hypothetical protein
MRLSKLSALAQSGLMLWAAYEHGDEMLFDGIGSSPTEWAWIVFQLRQADDNPDWFPKGKSATIQVIEMALYEEARAQRRDAKK